MAKKPLISGKIQYFKDRVPFNVRRDRDGQKESGTALLLFRTSGSGIAFLVKQQHRSPR